MITLTKPSDLKRLRRIAITAQGLNVNNPFGKGLKGTQQAIEHLSYVQLDTISVVQRAHHHVMHSRVEAYQLDMLNQLLQKGSIFEYWSHAAAYLPIADYRYSLPYKQAVKNGQIHWHKHKDKLLMNEVLSRIKIDGPLKSRDLDKHQGKRSGWWDWKPAKKALEQLFMEGDLMVCDRTGFQKTYDLTERVLPSNINDRMPSVIEHAEHMLDAQFRCHGLLSLKGVTYLRRNRALKNAVKDLIEHRLSQKALEKVQLKTGDVYYIPAGELEKPLPSLLKHFNILSPFDNLLIQRERLKHIFDFDYQIECYVPANKRRFGYFSLPLMYQDSFVGQMDCKAHQKTKVLELKSLHFSESVEQKSTVFIERMLNTFIQSLRAFMGFQQCDELLLNAVYPIHFKAQIQALLTQE